MGETTTFFKLHSASRCDFCDRTARLYSVPIPNTYKEFWVCKDCVNKAFTAFLNAYNVTLREESITCVSGGQRC